MLCINCRETPKQAFKSTNGRDNHASKDSIKIFTLFQGKCTKNNDIDSIDNKTFFQLKIRDNSLGYARIRSDATCFEPIHCNHNIMGTINCGLIVYGTGPLKSSRISAGIAYIIAIQDSLGNKCMGYVSSTVVEKL